MSGKTISFVAIIIGALVGSNPVFAQLKLTIVQKENFYGRKLGHLKRSQYIFEDTFNAADSEIDTAAFSLSEFYKTADFVSTKFKGRADIDNARFQGLADFMRATFKGRANFGGTKFEDEFVAEGSAFHDAALFFNTEFRGRTNFLICHFTGPAHFTDATFASRISFGNAIFEKGVSFKGTRVSGELVFTNTVFLDDVDFSNITTIANRIDLTVIKTDTIERQNKVRRGINLTNSDISKFKIDYSLFYLKFDPSATSEYRSNAYQSLLNTFKLDGYNDSYELLDKEFKSFTYAKKDAWFIHALDKYWWDYGYAKHYVFYWTFFLVGMFTILNFFFYPFLQRSVYKINNINDHFASSKWIAYLSRAYYSLVYTSVLFFSISVKLDNLKYRHWYAVAYIFVIYVLGIICLAYIANFVITK